MVDIDYQVGTGSLLYHGIGKDYVLNPRDPLGHLLLLSRPGRTAKDSGSVGIKVWLTYQVKNSDQLRLESKRRTGTVVKKEVIKTNAIMISRSVIERRIVVAVCARLCVCVW